MTSSTRITAKTLIPIGGLLTIIGFVITIFIYVSRSDAATREEVNDNEQDIKVNSTKIEDVERRTEDLEDTYSSIETTMKSILAEVKK